MADLDVARWHAVERLYQDVVDLDPADRAAYLDSSSPGDAGVRREVEALLGLTPEAAGFLETPAIADAAADLAAARGDLIGRMIGGYQIVSFLGSGGMGEVYRARDVRLERDAAVKVLDPARDADPASRRRFEDEARAASTLNHPNIVTIYGVGEADERTFIAMELIEGRTLHDRVAGDPVPVAAAIDLAAQIAAALAAAHDHGIVHRDLKPDNVMVTRDGHVKILDFGIATRVDPGAPGRPAVPAAATDPSATAVGEAGAVIGTVGYMSPEQVAGRPATAASDQFACGLILYELLTGRRAFRGESRIATLAAILHREPEPLAQANPAVPGAVSQIVTRCLAKRPEDRFADTHALEIALRQIASRTAIGGGVLITRRRMLAAAGGAAAAALSGAAIWRFWPPSALAVLPFAAAPGSQDADYLGLGLTDSLIWRMRALPLAVKPMSLVMNFAGAAADPGAIGRQLRVDYVLAGRVDLRDGRLAITAELVDVRAGRTVWTNTFERASADIFAMWDQIATAVVDDGLRLRLTRDERLRLLSRPTSSVEAYDAFLRARPLQMNGADADYLTARELLRRAVTLDPKFAEAWVALAGTYWTAALDNFIEPRSAWSEVERSLAAAAAVQPALPDLHNGAAIKAFFADWAWADADREWEIVSATPDRDIQPELLLTYALARWAMQDAAGALAIVRRARQIDPLSPVFALTEATYLAEVGRWEDAAKLYLAIAAAHPDSSQPYFGLAEARRAQQRYPEAVMARVKAHSLDGDDADEEMRDVMASATGEDGYRRLEATAVTRLELPRLERRRAQGGYLSPLDLARAYARLGDRDRALGYLADAFDAHAPALVFLNVDRAWDAVRADPIFRRYVARVGLPGSSERTAFGRPRRTTTDSWRQT